MSIPLDRLYHYIESVAQDVYGDTVIYHFSPHGSKKIEDLLPRKAYSYYETATLPEIFCHDQEPLDFDHYQVENLAPLPPTDQNTVTLNSLIEPLNQSNLNITFPNLRHSKYMHIFDNCILLHSEKNSDQVEKYINKGFVPVYYWSHALIAHDWYRFAKYCNFQKTSIKNKFLIYNRAWDNTREYRLKFTELVLKHNLSTSSSMKFNPIDPDTNFHYSDYQFKNSIWKPDISLDGIFDTNNSSSCKSADFNLDDYITTEFEVVLETLFDDKRIHLTEKILRPIACNHPFILVAGPGSLEYLKSYGFKTFDSVFDETYDQLFDPMKRLQSIIDTMSEINQWSVTQHQQKMEKIYKITQFNKQHFFSDNFFNVVVNELKTNLANGLNVLEKTNTSKIFFDIRKEVLKNSKSKQQLFSAMTRQDILDIVKRARHYYNRYLANKY